MPGGGGHGGRGGGGRGGRGGGRGGRGGGRGGNPLLNPGSQLSGRSLQQAAQALTNAQTQGPMSELQHQIAVNNAQSAGAEKLTADYFNQLGRFSHQGYQDEKGTANALNSQLAGIAGDTQGQLRGLQGDTMAQMERYSPQGQGGGLNAPAMQSLTAELARQQGLAAQSEGAYRSFGAAQGGNYRGLAASNEGTYGLRGQERLGDITRAGQLANEPLNSKIGALRAQAGALTAANEGKLRQQEITNRTTEAGLGIKAADLRSLNNFRGGELKAANARTAAENRRIAEQGRHDRVSEAIAQARVNAAAARGRAGARGKARALTPNEQIGLSNVLSRTAQLIQLGQSKGLRGQALRDALAQKLGNHYSDILTQAAFELVGWGFITPGTAAAMHQAGIRGGTYRGRPIRIHRPPPSIGSRVGNAIGNAGNAIGNALGG